MVKRHIIKELAGISLVFELMCPKLRYATNAYAGRKKSHAITLRKRHALFPNRSSSTHYLFSDQANLIVVALVSNSETKLQTRVPNSTHTKERCCIAKQNQGLYTSKICGIMLIGFRLGGSQF